MACLTRLSLCSIRQDKSTMNEGTMSLMQLPHMDVNNVKKLNRSKIRHVLSPARVSAES